MKPTIMPRKVLGWRFPSPPGARHPAYFLLPLALVVLALVLGLMARPAQANGSGTITIEKVSDYWGDDTSFDFSDVILGGFTLDYFIPERTFYDFPPGEYTYTEIIPDGWTLVDISCDDDNSGGDTGDATATISLESGEHVTCTFTNSADPGTVTIYKESDYWGDSTYFQYQENISTVGFFLDEFNQYHEFNYVLPGDYVVVEEIFDGWTLDDITCFDDDGGSYGDTSTGIAYIDVDPGEDVTCTFYNEANYGTVTIHKDSNYWGDSTTFDFTDDIEGSGFYLDEFNQTHTFFNVFPGDYTVTEYIDDGWTLFDITCLDDDGGSYGDTGSGTAYIDVDPGENVDCYFTNEVEYGKVTIVKESDYWGDFTTFDFEDDIYGSSYSLDEFNPTRTDDGVFPGDYTVTEHLPPGWTLDEIICDDDDGESYGDPGNGIAYIDLDPGEEVTCTFYNEADRGTVIIDKAVDHVDDTEFDFDEDIEYTGFTLSVPTTPSKTFNNVFPGDYTITEDALAGWELDDVNCTDDDGESYGEYTGRIAYIDVDPGETVNCTFTNSYIPPPPTSTCPSRAATSQWTDLLGIGMGSPTGHKVMAKVTIPNWLQTVDLYGQMVAKNMGAANYVRFLYPGLNNYVQVNAITSPPDPAHPAGTFWYGADLNTAAHIRGRWFLQPTGAQRHIPRALVLYPTYASPTNTYVNVWDTFDATEGEVDWNTAGGWVPYREIVVPIAAPLGETDFHVELALVDNDKDQRPVWVTVSAGGVSLTQKPLGPNKSPLLNLMVFNLLDVPAGTDEIVIEVYSPSLALDGVVGESASLVGMVANYQCEELDLP